MEELATLRHYIESGDLNGALAVLDEMEAMSGALVTQALLSISHQFTHE